MHRLFAPESLKRQRNCRLATFVEPFGGTALKRRSMQQMLQHCRSIYVAEIGRILRSADGFIRIISYFNNLIQPNPEPADFSMLQLCCSKDRSINSSDK
jgi:hypothetical protein